MLQPQSPQFSNSSKLNLASLISPARNKRIASVQNCCSSIHTHRNNNNNSNINNSNSNNNAYGNNSMKKLQSPRAADFNHLNICNNNKMRKKSQSNHTKPKPRELIAQMNNLRQEYLNMKVAYKELALKFSHRQIQIQQSSKLKIQTESLLRQNENLKGKVIFLEDQVDRIKRESMKLIEIWQFRTSRIEQNLKEKQGIIDELRDCLKIHGINEPRSSAKKSFIDFTKNQQKCNKQAYQLALISQSVIMGNYHRQNVSRMSQYLSISLNQVKQQSTGNQPVAKQLLVSADVGICLGDITNRTKQDQNRKNDHNNTKKMRKQLCKKIQVNIDDKHKQFLMQLQPKTPLERKNCKNNKSSKTKLKKQDQNIDRQVKSSKKKMSVKC